MSYRLSILDKSPAAAGASPSEALETSLAYAALADRLGYHRFWLADVHHSLGELARRHGVEEFILDSPIADHQARLRSIELIATAGRRSATSSSWSRTGSRSAAAHS